MVAGDARRSLHDRWNRLDAASGNWGTAATLYDGTANSFEPHIVMNANGNAVAVWTTQNNGVWSARYNATGAAWSTPARLQSVGAPNGGVPKVGIDETGRAIAVWLAAAVERAALHIVGRAFG